MFQTLRQKLLESLRILVILLLLYVAVQKLLNALIFAVIRYKDSNLKHFYFSHVLGTTVHGINIQTNKFTLQIKKLRVKIGWKPSINFHGIDLQILERPKDEEEVRPNSIPSHGSRSNDQPSDNGKSHSDRNSYFDVINETFNFSVSSRYMFLIKGLLSINTFIRIARIQLPNGNVISFNLCTLTIVHKQDDRFVMEHFVHGLTNAQTNETVNYVGFHLSFKMTHTQVEKDKFVKLAISEWHSSLKIGDAHVKLDKHVIDKKLEKDINKEPLDYLQTKRLVHKRVSKLVKSLKNPLRSLNVLDIKVENLRVTYKAMASINISSIQLYLEAVNVANYDTALDILPPNKHMWGDYEISISANSVLFKVGELSTFRIPLFNMIITTNVILHYAEDFPFNQTSLSITTNIVNPSIFSTISEITKVLKTMRSHKHKTTHNCNEQQPSNRTDDLLTAISKDLANLPNFIFEFNIANFTSTFQISENENIILKILNVQSLLGRCRTTKVKVKELVSLEGASLPGAKYHNRSSFSNFIKVVGTEFQYLKLSKDVLGRAVAIPICGFERLDFFLDEFSRTKMAVQCTLRHAYLTFDDLVVLERLHSSSTALLEMFSTKNESCSCEQSTPGASLFAKSQLQFSIKFRMKDIALSTVIASYIPVTLDPLSSQKFNLSDMDRGVRILIQETILRLENTVKTIEVKDATIYRVMENEDGHTTADTIMDLAHLNLVSTIDGHLTFNLPTVRFMLDTNLIWLAFYLKSMFAKYIPTRKEKATTHHKTSSSCGPNETRKIIRLLETTTINIDKVIIEVKLPEEVPVLFVVDNALYCKENTSLTISSISMLVQSAYTDSEAYFHLMEINDLLVDINQIITLNIIELNTSSIKLHTEYHFKFYMVLDNIITAYKSFKQLRSAFADLTTFKRVYPSVQLPKDIPKIRLLSDKVLVNVEEDLFEQELGLILKVGILEQRERLEKSKLLEKRIKTLKEDGNNTSNISSRNINTTIRNWRTRMNENFSSSWIARIRKAKFTFNGLPSLIEESENLNFTYKYISKQETSTVANLVIEKLDAKISPPSFPVNDYHDFLFDYGKGVPKDKSYTLLILMGIDFRTNLWELRLRDYPIPVLSLPDTHTTGDIVFAEKMPEKQKGLHSIFVPFVPTAADPRYITQNTIYGSNIIRTMNSVKTYFNIQTTVESGSPTHITWGKSLQPGFESFMLWFDYLTKPRLDPSEKVGFWDKFRFLFHGKWLYNFSEKSDLNINIKGAHDPYKIVDDGAGLSFCWSGGTALQIHGTPDPKEFLQFQSKSFKLGVRDFTAIDNFEKVLMQLDGDVTWKMGLMFEEGDLDNPGDSPRAEPAVPHYDIQLVNPEEVRGVENYDSYEGFRTNFIHMSFGVFSYAKDSSNNIYLGPLSIGHFLTWWRLFSTYTSGPIRQGPLFSDLVQNKTKFSRSLFSFKYQLHLDPLTVSHIYRHFTPQTLPDQDERTSFTGIKARLNSLKIDLHQKRIKLTHRNEKLNKSKPVWKFRINTGEIDCTEVDLRIVTAEFDKADVSKALSKGASPGTPIDEDMFKQNDWYRYEDYLDLNQIPLTTTIPFKFDAIPLMYSPKISYFRKLNDDGYVVKYPFGKEDSHDCLIGKNHPEKAQETLALRRKEEIEDQIRNVELSINNLQSASSKSKKKDKNIASLKKQLHELEHRLHIIHNILNDLHLSEVVSHTYSSDSSESSLHSSVSTDSNSTKGEAQDPEALNLLRTHTIDSFISMRRASTVQIQSTYDNRFMVHNIQLKVDKNIRDLLLEYSSRVFERKTVSYAMTYNSIKIFQELLKNVLTTVKTHLDDLDLFSDEENVSNREFIEQFDNLVKDVPDDRFDAVDRYLFRLISPQIQIRSDLEPGSVVILSARDIEVGIIDISQIMRKSGRMLAMDLNTVVETRYCAIAKDLQLITLFKEKLLNSETRFFHKNGYGMDAWSDFWPPWIPLEICYDGTLLSDHVFLKRRSMFLTFYQPNPLYFGDEDIITLSKDSKFRIGFPGLVLTSTSEQYCSVYTIIQDLLSFSSEYDEKVEKLSRVLLAEEIRNNLDRLDVSVLEDLQRHIKELHYTRAFLKQYKPDIYAKVSNDIIIESQMTTLRLTVLMTAIKKNYDAICGKSTSSGQKLTWTVGTDELIWKLFDNQNKPFITIGLSPSTFTRTETSDGVNSNKVSINALNCFNQQENPVFSQLLAPYKEHRAYNESIPMIEIFWIQGAAIGGISSIEELVVKLQPIIFKMDNNTGNSIMEYLFPKVDAHSHEKPSTENGHADPSGVSLVISPRSSDSFSNFSSVTSANKELVSWDLSSVNRRTATTNDHHKKLINPKTTTSSIFKTHEYNIDEMLKRSGTYFNVKFIKIEKTIMSVSYKGNHHLLTDVNRLTVKIPDMIYRDNLWSRDELIASVKHDVIRVVVKNMGSIIGNKFVRHKKENRSKVESDMNSIIDAEERDSNVTPTLFTEANRSNYSISLSKGSSSHSKILNFKNIAKSLSHGGIDDGDNEDVKAFFPSGKT